MLHPSTKKLVDRLAEMTELGKLSWTEGERGPIYSTEGYSVHLTLETGDLLITSKDGKELERASASDLGATPSDNGETYATIVENMAREATRIARGTETAITTLLAGIEQETVAPESAPADSEEISGEPEDIVDETEIVSTSDVVSFDAETAGETAPEPDAPPAEPDTPATEFTPAATEMAEEVDPAPQPEAEPELEATPDVAIEQDSEPDVSAAVARLAQEVNTQTEAQAETPDEASETAPEPILAAPSGEPHQYVPFGLNGHAPEAETLVPISETGVEPAVEDDANFGTEPDAPTFEPSNTPVFTEPAEAPEPVQASPEPEAASQEPNAQSFSLSGIGAGFGLGALKSTTEATGAPQATPEPEEEKIVIDATDDVPFASPEPTPEEASALPDVADLEPMASEPASEPAPTPEPEASDEPEDTPALKPRTRFNPWS